MSTLSCRRAGSLLVLLLASCHRDRPLDGSSAAEASNVVQPSSAPNPAAAHTSPQMPAQPPPAFVTPYPHGAWRLGEEAELDRTVLWLSQILIRHADARSEVSFNLAYWSSVLPTQRTRADALALAERVANEAAADPSRFADLARQYSEDLPRRDEGGAMGGVQAAQLAGWPHVLDAVAALRPEQSSRVVETRYGFHIFYLSPPPPEDQVSGAHLVIGHRDAQWLQVFGRDRQPTRSRDEALALATDLYRRASSATAEFADLVASYSEHRDAVVAGDFGAWSTREPTAFAPRLKRLRELRIGEVGAPIETHLGFEIIQRTPPRARKQYRARWIGFPFQEVSTEGPIYDPVALAAAASKAEAAVKQLLIDPTRFDELSGAGVTPVQWEEGRGVPGLAPALQAVAIGGIIPSPVESEYGLLVAQRLEPEPVPPLTWLTVLPAPQQPDVKRFMASLSAENLIGFLRYVADHAGTELGLGPEDAGRLQALHDVSARIEDATPAPARLAALGAMLDDTARLLGADRYALYGQALTRAVQDALLGAPDDAPSERGL